jgi:CRP-like cAMP-binding protein
MTDTNPSSIAAKAQEKALIGRLQQITAFSKLSTRHMQLMRKVAKPLPLQPDQRLFAEGDEALGLFVLMKGVLSVRREGVEVGIVEPIAAVGERWVLTGDPHDEEVISTDKGLALFIPQVLFAAFFDKEQELFNRMCRGVIEKFSDDLSRANIDQSQFANRRAALNKMMEEAHHDLNDARMIDSMRG